MSHNVKTAARINSAALALFPRQAIEGVATAGDRSRRMLSEAQPKNLPHRLSLRRWAADTLFTAPARGPHYSAMLDFLKRFDNSPDERAMMDTYLRWSRWPQEGRAIVENAARAAGLALEEYVAREVLAELRKTAKRLSAPPRDDSAHALLSAAPPADSFSIGEACDMTGMTSRTLRKYAEEAGVPTPKRGGRNHRFTREQLSLILKKIISGGSKRDRERAKETLAKIEIKSENRNQIVQG